MTSPEQADKSHADAWSNRDALAELVTPEAPPDSPTAPAGLRAAVDEIGVLYQAQFIQRGQDNYSQMKARAQVLEEQMPPMTAETLHQLGVAAQDWKFDEPATGAFRKEDDIETDPEEFSVLRDPEDQLWLLKGPDWEYRGAPEEHKARKLTIVADLHGEVESSRVADLVDYPVPRTQLVEYDGLPWLASRYMPTKREDNPGPAAVSNPHDRATRPLFNALVEATGDQRSQGIVDQADGKYYAIDVSSGLRKIQPEETVDEAKRRILAGLNAADSDAQGYGRVEQLSPAEYQVAAGEFIKRLATLTPESATMVYADLVGPAAERDRRVRALLTKVAALRSLHDEGLLVQPA